MRAIDFACTFLFLMAASSAAAHDLDDGSISFVESDETNLARAPDIALAVTALAIADLDRLWRPGSTLKVCFFADRSSERQRRFLAETASIWVEGTSLSLDFGQPSQFNLCGPNEDFNIRVTFDTNVRSFSVIGSDTRLEPQSSPTMNIRSSESSGSALRSTILHEFGHALGLRHEHQHPRGGCGDEWNWAELERRLTQLSADEIKSYFGSYTERRLSFVSYDSASIMHYSFPAEFYVGGASNRCFIPKPTGLSEGDRQRITQLYPETDLQQASYIGSLRTAYTVAMIENSADLDSIIAAFNYTNATSGMNEFGAQSLVNSLNIASVLSHRRQLLELGEGIESGQDGQVGELDFDPMIFTLDPQQAIRVIPNL